jgi:hypothetical protein
MCCDADQIIVLQARATLTQMLRENRHKQILMARNVRNGREHRKMVQSELIKHGVAFRDDCFESIRAMPSMPSSQESDQTDNNNGMVDLIYILKDRCDDANRLQTVVDACKLVNCSPLLK